MSQVKSPAENQPESEMFQHFPQPSETTQIPEPSSSWPVEATGERGAGPNPELDWGFFNSSITICSGTHVPGLRVGHLWLTSRQPAGGPGLLIWTDPDNPNRTPRVPLTLASRTLSTHLSVKKKTNKLGRCFTEFLNSLCFSPVTNGSRSLLYGTACAQDAPGTPRTRFPVYLNDQNVGSDRTQVLTTNLANMFRWSAQNGDKNKPCVSLESVMRWINPPCPALLPRRCVP